MSQTIPISTPNWNDANVFGDLGSPEASSVLAQTVNVLCGFSKYHETGTWWPWPVTVERLIDEKLSLHEVAPSKDGHAIVFADSVEPVNGKKETPARKLGIYPSALSKQTSIDNEHSAHAPGAIGSLWE